MVKAGAGGVPVLLKDVARVELGPEIRRGISDLDGLGDHVGGIVVMRHGENALNVIERVKEKLHELEPSLPSGVEVVTTYDRSDLIHRAIDTLKHELTIEMIIVSLVILLFLWHIPSALVPIADHPDLGAAGLHPAVLHGRHGQHHVAGRHRHLDRRAGRRRDRRGGERLQQAPPLGGRRPEGRLPRGPPRGAQGGRAVGLLLAAGDRGRVPPGVRPGGPGRPAVQAAGLLQEPGDGAGRGARHHPRPGDADAVHAHGPLHASSRGSWRGSRRGPWSAPTTPRRGTRSAGCCSRSTSRPAASCCATPRR